MEKVTWQIGAVTDTRAADKITDPLGGLRWVGSKLYRLMKNNGSNAVAVGDVVLGKHTDEGDIDSYFYDDAESNLDISLMQGVCVSAIAAGDVGWIQVLGYNSQIKFALGATTDIDKGDSMIPVADKNYVVFGAAHGAAPLSRRTIIAGEDYSSDAIAAKKGYIHCL